MEALSPHHLRKLGLPKNLVIGGATIKSVASIRNLGAHFDTHVNKKCNFHLRRIKSISPFITKRVCQSLVIALVVLSLDYCKALLLDIPEYHLTHFQKIHNRAACLVVLTPISAHITSVLEDLHWLPVSLYWYTYLAPA